MNSSNLYMNVPNIEKVEEHMKLNAPKLYRQVQKDFDAVKRGISPANPDAKRGLPGLVNKAVDWIRGDKPAPKPYEDLSPAPDFSIQSSKQAQLQDKMSKIKSE